jgi:hypothetical protein
MHRSVPPKASKAKLKVYSPNRLNYFIYNNGPGKNTPWGIAKGHKLLTSPGVANRYAFLMYTSNTLLESYQQRVSKNTLA